MTIFVYTKEFFSISVYRIWNQETKSSRNIYVVLRLFFWEQRPSTLSIAAQTRLFPSFRGNL